MSKAILNVVVRLEQPTDLIAIRGVNLAAFPGPAEANLVDKLRAVYLLLPQQLRIRDIMLTLG